MISLRLSEVDYKLLKTQYRAYGARNISDLARLALRRLVTGSAGLEGDCTARLEELAERVRTLESQISRLAEWVKTMS